MSLVVMLSGRFVLNFTNDRNLSHSFSDQRINSLETSGLEFCQVLVVVSEGGVLAKRKYFYPFVQVFRFVSMPFLRTDRECR